jgi:hypothetical protein
LFYYSPNDVCSENGQFLVATNQTTFGVDDGIVAFGFSAGSVPDGFQVQLYRNATLYPANPQPLDEAQLDALASQYTDESVYGTWFAGGQYYVFTGLTPGVYGVVLQTNNGLCQFSESITLSSAADPCLTVEQVNFISTPVDWDPNNPDIASSNVTIEWSSGFATDGVGDLFYAYGDPVTTNAIVYNYADLGSQINTNVNPSGNYVTEISIPAPPDYDTLTDTEAQVWITMTNNYGCTILLTEPRTLFFSSSPCAFSSWDELIASVTSTNETFIGLNDGTITVTPVFVDLNLTVRLRDNSTGTILQSQQINSVDNFAPVVFDNLAPDTYDLTVLVSDLNQTGIDGCEYDYPPPFILIIPGDEPPPPPDPFALDTIDEPTSELIYSSVDENGINTYPSGITLWSSGSVSVVETTIEGVFGNWIKVQTGGAWSGVDLNIDDIISPAMNVNDKLYVCFDIGAFGQIGNTPSAYNGPGGSMWNHRIGDNNQGANYNAWTQEDTTFTWDGVSYTATAPANLHYNFDMGVSRRRTGQKTWGNGWNGSVSIGYKEDYLNESNEVSDAADMHIRNIRVYRIPYIPTEVIGG